MDFNFSQMEKMIVKTAQDFCERKINPIVDYIVDNNDYPSEFMEDMAAVKFLGMTIPKEYGGLASSNLNVILVGEEIGKTGTSCFWPFAMNNSVAETINHWGSDELKKQVLPSFCEGSGFATMAFTEPATGSDPRAITSTAVTDGDHYVVNGSKRFITSGNKPGYGIFYLKDKELEGEREDITALVIDKSVEGYSTSKPWKLMGLEGNHVVDVTLDNIRVPKSNIIGEPGKGFRVLLNWIAGERIQQAAFMVGLGQAALEESIAYAKSRMVGGKPQAAMQGFQWMLADMKVKVDACRCLTQRAAFMQDDGQSIEVVSAELKTFVTPTIQEVTRQAMQVHGSYGYSREYKVERIFRAAAHAGVMATSTELNKTIAGMSLLR